MAHLILGAELSPRLFTSHSSMKKNERKENGTWVESSELGSELDPELETEPFGGGFCSVRFHAVLG